MKCSKCGKEIYNDSNFCEYCGTKVVNNKKKKTIKIALIVLSVVFAMVGLGWGGVILSEYIEEQNTLARAKTLSALGVDEWVDLALPSGTLWYGKNADCLFYNYDEAMEQFGNNMPTKEQFDELINNCTCTWTGEGYNIEGSNGNSIFLPAAGYRSNALLDVGDFGIYWSSTHLELKAENCSYISRQAWGLALGHDSLNKLECNTYNCDIYSNFSVRLVHAPFERLEPSSSQNKADSRKPVITEEQARVKAEQERQAEQARVEAEQARVEAEQERQAEQARVEAEQERQAEQARVEAEQERQAEQARVKAEQERQAEQARVGAEQERQAEQARVKAEQERFRVKGFVDLGLPSGTLWKAKNEVKEYEYDSAVKKFGDNLPTLEHWRELKDYCKWEWTGRGYKITGANGNSIVLPATDKGSHVRNGIAGFYWMLDERFVGERKETAPNFCFCGGDKDEISLYGTSLKKNNPHAVRLIQGL